MAGPVELVGQLEVTRAKEVLARAAGNVAAASRGDRAGAARVRAGTPRAGAGRGQARGATPQGSGGVEEEARGGNGRPWARAGGSPQSRGAQTDGGRTVTTVGDPFEPDFGATGVATDVRMRKPLLCIPWLVRWGQIMALAYHPLVSDAVLRCKNAAGLAEWGRRNWQMFNGLSPIIVDATDSLQALVEAYPTILLHGRFYVAPRGSDDATLALVDARSPPRSGLVRDDWRSDLPGGGVSLCHRCRFELDQRLAAGVPAGAV